MKIYNDYRLAPYTLSSGESFLLISSSWSVRVFPTLLEFTNISTGKELSIPVCLQEQVTRIHVEQNMKNRKLWITLSGSSFYLRYALIADKQQIYCIIDRSSESEITFGEQKIEKKECVPLNLPVVEEDFFPFSSKPSWLNLGNYRKQETVRLHRQLDLTHTLPILWQMGLYYQKTPSIQEYTENSLWLKQLDLLIEHKQHDQIKECLTNFYRTTFSNNWIPSFQDKMHWGAFKNEKSTSKQHPLSLLKECFSRLSRLWLEEKEEEVHLLPHMPPELHCGKLTDFEVQGLGVLHLEWTKKKLRRLIFHCHHSKTFAFHFSKVNHCRLYSPGKEKEVLQTGQTYQWNAGSSYFLDNFKK